MKPLKILIALASLLLCSPAFAAPAQITVRPYEIGARPVDPVFNVPVDTTGVEKGTLANPTYTSPATGATYKVQGFEAASVTNTANPVVIGGTSSPNAVGGSTHTWVVNASGQGFVVGNMVEGSAGISSNGFFVGGSDGTTYRHLQTDTSGNLKAGGNVASAATDSGNPLKVGCVYNSTLPTVTTGQRVDCQMNARGNIYVSLAGSTNNADGGNITYTTILDQNAAGRPLGVIGLLNSTGAIAARPIDVSSASAVSTGVGVTAVEQNGALFSNITTATTTTVKSGAGILHKIVINTHVASATLTIYDNTSAASTKIGTITLPSTITGEGPESINYDLRFATGLTIVTSGATDITVVYR